MNTKFKLTLPKFITLFCIIIKKKELFFRIKQAQKKTFLI